MLSCTYVLGRKPANAVGLLTWGVGEGLQGSVQVLPNITQFEEKHLGMPAHTPSPCSQSNVRAQALTSSKVSDPRYLG